MEQNVFAGNLAVFGGGMACDFGSPVVARNEFRSNAGEGSGGGLSATNGSPTVSGNTFEDNVAGSGGGCHLMGGTVSLHGNRFLGNVAGTAGAVMVFQAVDPGAASLNTFDGNVATTRAGAVRTSFFTDILWTRNEFTRNVAPEAGAVSVFGSSDLWVDNVFRDNRATGVGEAVVELDGAARMVRADIRGRPGDGVAVLLDGARLSDSLVTGHDTGVSLRNGGVVQRCTVAGNALEGVTAQLGGNVVTGSVVWGNGTDLVEDGGVLGVTWTTAPGGWPGVGNDGADPLFVDAPGGDHALSSGSPCIDTGDPADAVCATDLVDGLLDGGSRVDRGAFDVSHVRLTALQPISPASPVGFDTTGTPGLPVWVFLALGTDTLCVEPYGTFLVDLDGPWILRFAGSNPTSVAVPPFGGASGITAYLQAVATSPDGTLGTTSNVDAFTFP